MSKNKSTRNRQITDNEEFYNPDISGVQKSEDYLKKLEAAEAIEILPDLRRGQPHALRKLARADAHFARGAELA